VDATPLLQVDRGVHIDHQPALFEAEVTHAGADVLAYQAVCAVAAQ
jgi:hypothetical protein